MARRPKTKRPTIKLPDDFDDETTFLAFMRREFYEDVQYLSLIHI